MSSPFGPMVLIVNARAGKGGVAGCLPEVESHLQQRGLEYEVRPTEGPGHASVLARDALV
jgi:diacylglycerol kinase family enzyme